MSVELDLALMVSQWKAGVYIPIESVTYTFPTNYLELYCDIILQNSGTKTNVWTYIQCMQPSHYRGICHTTEQLIKNAFEHIPTPWQLNISKENNSSMHTHVTITSYEISMIEKHQQDYWADKFKYNFHTIKQKLVLTINTDAMCGTLLSRTCIAFYNRHTNAAKKNRWHRCLQIFIQSLTSDSSNAVMAKCRR